MLAEKYHLKWNGSPTQSNSVPSPQGSPRIQETSASISSICISLHHFSINLLQFASISSICINLSPMFHQFTPNLPQFTPFFIICTNIPQFASICTNLPQYASIYSNMHQFTKICINLFQFASKRDLLGDPGVPLRSVNGPKYLIWMWLTQAHCVEVFWTPFGPSRPSPGSKGSKKGPKNGNFHILAVSTPKTALGQSSSKHKSYLRYRDGLWRFNRDFYLFRFSSRKLATWADMGPPTGNRGAPGATSGPLFPSHMTLQ